MVATPGSAVVEADVRTIESHFAVALGRPERVEEACADLRRALLEPAGTALVETARDRLLGLLSQRRGPVADALFRFLADWARQHPDPASLATGLLGARDPRLRAAAADLLLELHEGGRLRSDPAVLDRLAETLDDTPDVAGDPIRLARLEDLVRRWPREALPAEPADAVEALWIHGSSPALRALASRLLDVSGAPVTPERAARALGEAAAAFLAPLLEYTRATHRDLVDLTPEGGARLPALPSLVAAAERLGPRLLGEVIAQLGWVRVAWGLEVIPLVGLAIDESLPLVVRPEEMVVLEACSNARRLFTRFLVVAHGGGPAEAALAGEEPSVVRRFRSYNLVHAEVLSELLEVAPLSVPKVHRLVHAMDSIVADYAALFGAHDDEAVHLPEVYAKLREAALAEVAGAEPDAVLPSGAARLVLMFEDPHRLAEVRTLHGLKRYLHQRGLRQAFRLFRSARATNRTVDLAVTSAQRVLRVAQRIRYLDFEPHGRTGVLGLPRVVALAAEAYGRQLVLGERALPSLEILGYGNEVHVYVQFRNHPAFVRVDLSPPLRGGMLDLEYFAVSQYELDQHPDRTIPAIRQFFRSLDFDVEVTQLHLHARYDKERAFDLGDLTAKLAALLRLVPYLMDLDWVIGNLAYPRDARERVAHAWAELFARWGVLPVEALLTADRTQILAGVASGPAGDVELPWDGRGEYRDRVSGLPRRPLFEGLREALAGLGLDWLARWEALAGQEPAQLPLERAVLVPLREAVARGEVVATPGGLRPAPRERFEREHEADRFARVLAGAADGLERAASVAALVTTFERHLRLRTTGAVNGYPVQRAELPLAGEWLGLAVLRDAQGVARLALAVDGATLFRSRAGPGEPWVPSPELEPAELAQRLWEANYLDLGCERGAEDLAVAALAQQFARPNPAARTAPAPGDRVLPGVPAAPGRAAGFASFDKSDAKELDGAVLLAPAIRPEDAPLLHRVAGLVSTGGGALSHAGLIAQELQKPALIVEGRWGRGRDGATFLCSRRAEFRREEAVVEGLPVERRLDFRELDETVEAGELVVVDAEESCLVILGRERDALALHEELSQLDRAAERLARATDPRETLSLRGRSLRAMHQLEKLLRRIDRGDLARYAVFRLLRDREGADATNFRAERRLLLQALLANPACREAASDVARQRLAALRRRHAELARTVPEAITSSGSLFEILFLRLQLLRAHQTLSAAVELAADCGLDAGDEPAGSDVEAVALDALERLQRDLRGALADPVATALERHILRAWGQVQRVLGPLEPTAERLELSERRREVAARSGRQRRDLAGRLVVGPADGGLELLPIVGPKAANLGEIGRLLGPERVPAWFAVTDDAFREVLAAPAGPAAAELGLDGAAQATLGDAIGAVLSRRESEPRRQAAEIRHLWRTATLPPSVREALVTAYRSLAPPAPDPLEGAEAGPVEPLVAIRSSAFEEDTEASTWAGQFDTFLFISGEQALVEYLELAWAGLWGERALHHRRYLGSRGTRAGGGVIVQRVVRARASGVLHTVDVAAGHCREMLVNVGLGLGEGIVSGTVGVDQIVVSKDGDLDRDPLVFRYRVGDKRERVVFDSRAGVGTRREETRYHQRLRPALEYVELAELVRAAARLEAAYRLPLDIEFALEGSALYVLQARPVSAFEAAVRATIARSPPVWRPALGADEEVAP